VVRLKGSGEAKPLLGGVVRHPKLLQPRLTTRTFERANPAGLHGARKICH